MRPETWKPASLRGANISLVQVLLQSLPLLSLRFFPALKLHDSKEGTKHVGKPSKTLVDGETFKHLQNQVLANPLILITKPRTQTNTKVKPYMLNRLLMALEFIHKLE